MSRPTIVALTITGIVAAVIVAAPAIVSVRLAGMEIADRISTLTGARVTVHGEPAVTLFPSLGVEVTEVVVSGRAGTGGGPLMTIPSVRASLDLVPFLVGRVDMETLTLVDPDIRLAGQPGNNVGWSAGSPGTVFSGIGRLRLDEVILRNGSITYGRHGTGVISAINLRLARRGGPRTVKLTGAFEWHDVMVEIDAELDDVGAVLDGAGSGGRLRLAAAPVRLSRDQGSGGGGQGGRNGNNHRSIQSLRYFIERLAIPIAPGATFGPLLVAGTFEADAKSLTLSHATLELDGEAADGTLSVRLGGGRPMLKGSLVFEKIDLGPYIERFPRATLAETLAASTSTGWLSRADIDLTAAVDEVDLGNGRLTDASIALLARGGRMSFALSEAALAGGSMQGSVIIEAVAEQLVASLSACLDDVSTADVAGLFRARGPDQLIGAGEPLRGTGTLRLELTANGDTINAFTESLSGVIVAGIRDGSVGGIDVESTLERLVDGNTVIAGGHAPFVPVTGRTGFESLSTYAVIEEGIARVGRIHLKGDRYHVTLSGQDNLTRGEIEAEGIASLFDSRAGDNKADSQPLVQLPFGVGGAVRKPMIVPGIPRVGHGPHMEREAAYSGSSVAAPDAVPRGAGTPSGQNRNMYVHCSPGLDPVF